jgi:exodeoxyribonuclease VII small subunit
MSNQIEELTFEAAFEELEQLVSRLEDGGLTLEESLAMFERDEAELKVQQITSEGDTPFQINA